MSRRSSMGTRLMVTCHALVWLLLLASGCASSSKPGGLRNGVAINHEAVHTRGLKKEEDMQKGAKETFTEAPNTVETQVPSAAEVTVAKQVIEFQLLPFTIEVHGPLSADEAMGMREELEGYLLNSFLEEDTDEDILVETDSIELTVTKMEEIDPLAEQDQGDETLDDEGTRSRTLSLVLTSSMIPTVSTLVSYEASAVLSFRQEKEVGKDIIEDTSIDIQERQIEVLENTKDLQEFFLEVFALEQQVNSDVDYVLQDPVVLMEVQIDDREAQSLSWEETLEKVQMTLDALNPIDTPNDVEDESEDEGYLDNENGVISNLSDESAAFSENNASIFSWKVIVGIVCAAMVLLGLVAVLCVSRKKKNQHSKKSGAVVEVKYLDESDDRTNDVVEKNFMTESNTVSTGNNISVESDAENPTVSKNIEEDSEIPVSGRQSKNSSRFSFFQKKNKTEENEDEQTNTDDNDDMDSFGEKINLYNVTTNDDDDSMMGYSLTSYNRNRFNNEGGQDDSLLDTSLLENEGEQDDSLVEDLSIISSISEACSNLVLVGVQKILEQNKTPNSIDQQTGQTSLGENIQWNKEQSLAPSLLGDDNAIDSTQEESLSRSATFETEDAEGANTNDDDGARYGDIQPSSSDEIRTKASKYYGEDEIMMPQQRKNLVAAPTEEFHGLPSRISPVIVDDASDAPSDERNSGPAMPPQRGTTDPYRYPDAIRNSKLVDNDPAVLDYLVKGDTRSSTHGMTGSIPQHSRMTMEL